MEVPPSTPCCAASHPDRYSSGHSSCLSSSACTEAASPDGEWNLREAGGGAGGGPSARGGSSAVLPQKRREPPSAQRDRAECRCLRGRGAVLRALKPCITPPTPSLMLPRQARCMVCLCLCRARCMVCLCLCRVYEDVERCCEPGKACARFPYHTWQWTSACPHNSPYSVPPTFPLPHLQQGMCALPLPHVAVDFRLPPAILSVDLEERDDGTLPVAAREFKPRYIHINSNIHLRPPPVMDDEDMGCDCKGGSNTACGDDCMCRAQYLSCTNRCGCHGGCCNRPFSRPKRLDIVQTQRCGWGAMAAEPIKAGEFIVEYAGEVIDDAMCEARLWAMRAGGATDFYICEVSRDVVIDATFRGGHGRFVNHSCAPNAELQKWLVEGHVQVGIFAIKDIAVGTEVAYDYRFVSFGLNKACQCGAERCRGVIGANPPTTATATPAAPAPAKPERQAGTVPRAKPWNKAAGEGAGARTKGLLWGTRGARSRRMLTHLSPPWWQQHQQQWLLHHLVT
ncbi:unnamed protein product [Closterium sp. Naga37s-1]|nr:unnamed protein product [Closterium sp. Naga37s-1]